MPVLCLFILIKCKHTNLGIFRKSGFLLFASLVVNQISRSFSTPSKNWTLILSTSSRLIPAIKLDWYYFLFSNDFRQNKYVNIVFGQNEITQRQLLLGFLFSAERERAKKSTVLNTNTRRNVLNEVWAERRNINVLPGDISPNSTQHPKGEWGKSSGQKHNIARTNSMVWRILV